MGSSEDRQKAVRSYDQASLFSDGSGDLLVCSDDSFAVLPEKKAAYISQLLASLTVLTVSISYKRSKRKHSKVPACPMNRSTTGVYYSLFRRLPVRRPRKDAGVEYSRILTSG